MRSPVNLLMQAARAMFRRRIAKLERQLVADVRQLLDGENITLLDVGSAGGIEPRWKPYRSQIKYIGIEPDSRSSAALVASAEAKLFADYRIVQQAVWNKNDVISFNLCRKPMVSSHFLPKQDFVQRYAQSERFDILKSASLSCQTVDNVLSTQGLQCDFIKLDIQGGELAVLEGADQTLEQCLGLEIEVEFLRMYEDQPLFGDICAFLDTKGLEFIDFTSFNRWERSDYRGLGQCVFGDALFLRSPENVVSRLKNGQFGLNGIKRYLAVLRIYSRVDLMDQTLNIVMAAQYEFDSDYLKKTRLIMHRIRSYLNCSVIGLGTLERAAKLWNPSAQLHLIY